ncbi:MAG: holo-ACP synthase [Epulopiscium sp.]|nr:holo-ACP synthase [Candidatus Epulonipiscium sp.]
MIVGIGTDIIEIRRIEEAIKRNPKFTNKCFTKEEQELFKDKNNSIQTIAGTFAAKEAVVKAMGTGFRGFGIQDIEILRDKKGKPYVNSYSNARLIFNELNIADVLISISHCRDYAVAYALAKRGGKL